MAYLLVGLGGVLGSLARFGLGRYIASKSKSAFPASTLLINITGAFLLGILSQLSVSNEITLFLGDGFLGAYTTFSTFMYEGFSLLNEKKVLNALIYIVSSFVIGIFGFFIGTLIV